jgi:ATP-dependent Zn protease
MNIPKMTPREAPPRSAATGPMRGCGAVLLATCPPLAACLALVLPSPAAMAAAGATTGAAGAPESSAAYQKESEATFEGQLASGQIAAARINKRRRSVRIRLKDGRHVFVKYPAKQEPRLRAELQAKGVPVKVLQKSEALAEQKAKPHHHKLRYIVGGAVLLLIAILGTLFYFWRRRKRQRREREPAVAAEPS